jgi:hypothetical protein
LLGDRLFAHSLRREVPGIDGCGELFGAGTASYCAALDACIGATVGVTVSAASDGAARTIRERSNTYWRAVREQNGRWEFSGLPIRETLPMALAFGDSFWLCCIQHEKRHGIPCDGGK